MFEMKDPQELTTRDDVGQKFRADSGGRRRDVAVVEAAGIGTRDYGQG